MVHAACMVSLCPPCKVFLGEMYEDMRSTYYDHIAAWRESVGNYIETFPDYLSFEEWVGRPDGVPGGDVFRDLFTNAQYVKGGAGPDSSVHDYRWHSSYEP